MCKGPYNPLKPGATGDNPLFGGSTKGGNSTKGGLPGRGAAGGDAVAVMTKAREKGLLLTVAGGNVVRFAPALVVSREEIDEAVAILDSVLAEV